MPFRCILRGVIARNCSLVPSEGESMKRREKCLKEELAKKHACYVLITCDEPTCDGKMQVEMSYEGPTELAAYLLHGAQLHVDEQEEEGRLLPSDKQKIHYFNP